MKSARWRLEKRGANPTQAHLHNLTPVAIQISDCPKARGRDGSSSGLSPARPDGISRCNGLPWWTIPKSALHIPTIISTFSPLFMAVYKYLFLNQGKGRSTLGKRYIHFS